MSICLEFRLAGEVLRASLREEDGGRPIPDLPKFISRFFSLCLKENFLRLAQEMWESPEINKTGFKRILRNLRIKYLTLLYRNGSHQEVKRERKRKQSQICALIFN